MSRAPLIVISIAVLASSAHAGPAVTAAALAPSCTASTADHSSPHARSLFAHLPRKPQQTSKVLVKCDADAVAIYVITYAHDSDAPEEAHVIGTYLWGPSGPSDAHGDGVLVQGATVVVVSPGSAAAAKALGDRGFVAYVPSTATATTGKTTEQWIDVFRGTDYDAMDVAIAGLTKQGAAAVPALTKALADPKPMVRSQCAAALGKIGKPAAAAVAALIKLLTDADTDNRWNAANALGEIGPAAKAALPSLKQLASDKVAQVASAATAATAKIEAK